jgi:phosphinothricin acetyltransferase
MIEIRSIPNTDISQILEIYQQGLDLGYATFNTEAPSAEKWDTSHHSFCRIGAYQGELLVGWAALSPVSVRDCYRGVAEVSLYIRNGFHGQGIGTSLMRETIQESERFGIWTLYSSITSTNTASIRMCLATGWRIIGIREKIAKDRFGVWQDTTILERRSTVVGID